MESALSSAPAPTASVASRLAAMARSFTETTGLPIGYLICAPIAVAALWGHHFLPGIDLPEHAELVRLWLDVRRGVPDIANLYQLKPMTPYTVPYIIAYPVAVLFGAMSGIKFVLTVAVLLLPAMMSRWLKVVGGDPRMGVVGFAIMFGWAFLWGFFSHLLALGVMFAYLTAFEEQGVSAPPLRIFETFCWAILLFFCHGVTFGLAMLIAGARFMLRPRPWLMWRSALHVIPLGALTLYWMHLQEKAVSDKSGPWLMDIGRLRILFSGLFCTQVNTFWANFVACALVVWVLFMLPKVNWRPAAWVPFLVTTLLFAILPGHIVATELIGPRFTVYVQVFAPGIIMARPGRWSRHMEWSTIVLVVVCLIVLHVRLYKYNQEMGHYVAVTAKVEPGSDIQTFMPKSSGGSEIFGYRNMALAGAWFVAEHGGIIDDDYAARFNMPVQRKKVNFPTRYRYIFTNSKDDLVKKTFPDATLLAKSAPWAVWERAPQFAGKFPIVRSGQGWGDLQIDQSVVETPISIAGKVYDHGLGTHADSWIELRAAPGATTLGGACGLDDSGRDEARIQCRIRLLEGEELWRSAALKQGDEPATFSVTFPPSGILLLEVFSASTNKGTHADWVDLH